jgi:hypothetical protein
MTAIEVLENVNGCMKSPLKRFLGRIDCSLATDHWPLFLAVLMLSRVLAGHSLIFLAF